MTAEQRSTGVSPELTELDQVLTDIVEMEEVASTSQEIDEAARKEKEDTDKQKAESIRKMAIHTYIHNLYLHVNKEKLGETQKRAVEEGEKENHMKIKGSCEQVMDECILKPLFQNESLCESEFDHREIICRCKSYEWFHI